ncbi:MAG TPA: SDR family NAD(P)-dependent oxidoreductase, partial [Dehalococcoidia bacterium]|nr:SDR family NAD(P)-dependent oxidoreductase [Dehalococcoidia bacterium]
QADVSTLGSMEVLADRTFDRFGAIHLLCNNAGVFTLGALTEATEADWDWLLRVNVMGVVHGLQAFLPQMRAQAGEAHVVNTASLAGLIAPRGLPIGVYTATKYAVVGISETLRLELEEEGIGVSVLCPGGVQTRIWEAERNRPTELGGPQDMEARGEFSTQGAAGGQLDPEEVGRMVMAGVKGNELYVMTHPETKGLVRRRFESIMAAFEGME